MDPSPDRKKLLITGVSGLLGNNLARYFRDSYRILGTYQQVPVVIEGIETCKADILDLSGLKTIVHRFDPDVVVHCASLTNIDYCETHRELTEDINVGGTRNLVDSIGKPDCKLIYISSDSVYEGTKGDYRETDPVAPQNHYGQTKYMGELEVLKRERSLVLRTNIFGWNIQDKNSLAEWILSELTTRRSIGGFRDACFSTIYNFLFAGLLEAAIGRELNGIYNCASRTALSKYQFAVLLAETFNLDKGIIKPISIDDHHFAARRGKDLSLNVKKIGSALQMDIPTIADSIKAFHRDHARGLPERIRAGGILAQPGPSPVLYYGKHDIDQDDIEAVAHVLRSSNITQGPRIPEFESALCQATDAPHSVACNSGTSALHMACLAAGVQNGDEVITSPITFVASANCAVYCGAKPVFADIDPRTYNISPAEIEGKITRNTRAVIPVHFAGQSCDMASICEIVRSAAIKYGRKIYIVEDACHALGSLYNGSKVGSCTFSDMAVTSFHPVKHITTGEGGAVFTRDKALLRKLRLLRSHGITSDPEEFLNIDMAFPADAPGERNPWYYEQIALGFNYRITDIQCALGLAQLKKLDRYRERRRLIVDTYNGFFEGRDLIRRPAEVDYGSSNYHLYVLLIDFARMALDRARFMLKLRLRGIQTQVHYIPVHLQSYYRTRFGTNRGDCPEAESYYEKCLSIPLYPTMSNEDVNRVASEILSLMVAKR
jgi:UDP-4-amino-4,6-dideoxy-N-acetyl-beta-L-altrosamine transaminase/dTDP-4-dehydrorhamnose reductase